MLCSVPRMLNVSEYILLDVVISSTVEHLSFVGINLVLGQTKHNLDYLK